MNNFYQKALDLWRQTQINQIMKGLEKYHEPFTPRHWTADQLLNHALEESVDLVHYVVGLKELLDDREAEIKRLTKENEYLCAQLKGWTPYDQL
jgi:hypothetical protein